MRNQFTVVFTTYAKQQPDLHRNVVECAKKGRKTIAKRETNWYKTEIRSLLLQFPNNSSKPFRIQLT